MPAPRKLQTRGTDSGPNLIRCQRTWSMNGERQRCPNPHAVTFTRGGTTVRLCLACLAILRGKDGSAAEHAVIDLESLCRLK